jgi:hypothetical protein
MVLATAVPDNAPTRLRIAAMLMATLGERTRLPITVAIALAASVKPLTIPKAIDTPMTTRRRPKEVVSGILEHYAF